MFDKLLDQFNEYLEICRDEGTITSIENVDNSYVEALYNFFTERNAQIYCVDDEEFNDKEGRSCVVRIYAIMQEPFSLDKFKDQLHSVFNTEFTEVYIFMPIFVTTIFPSAHSVNPLLTKKAICSWLYFK